MRRPAKHKTIRHFHEPGDFHELTFSCYKHLPLLTNNVWRRMLAESINRAMVRWEFRLHAFVFMPEHVHLLVYPLARQPRIDGLLKAIKRPYSYRVKQMLLKVKSPLINKLTVRERPGVYVFRYWQEGPGYDRNLDNIVSVGAATVYFHRNPCRRNLCKIATDWKWSSARFHASDGTHVDPDLPQLSTIPPEFFDN